MSQQIKATDELSKLLDEEAFEIAANFEFDEVAAEPKALAYRAYAKWKLHQFRSAINDFDKALAMRPGAPNSLFLRGRCHEELDDFSSAISDYHTVLQLEPQTADAHAHLGFCFERIGDSGKAKAAYHDALAIDPDESLALAGLKSLAP